MLLVLVLVPPVRCAAWRTGLVDRPEAAMHKSHSRVTPYGGVAIWLAVVATITAAIWANRYGAPLPAAGAWQRPVTVLLACATAVMLAGLVDDRRALPALPRLLVQLLAGLILLRLCPAFRLPVGPAGTFQILASLLWILALTNALNFLDNMDGLAAGISAVVCLLLVVMAWITAQAAVLVLAAILLGALIGFLRYNLPPASIFMGDAGILFVGFLLSSTTAMLSRHVWAAAEHGAGWLAPLLLLVVPVYDLVSVTAIRLRNGAAPWAADNNHISHRLSALGLSRPAAVGVIHLSTLVAGLPALLLLHLSAGGAAALGVAYLSVIAAVGLADSRARRSLSNSA